MRKYWISSSLMLLVAAGGFLYAQGGVAKKPPNVVVLTGSPLGGVKFDHKKHSERLGTKCEGCHHASKPAKVATSPQQACRDCHLKVATAPMKTKLQGAFHNATAQAGTCIDCHKAESAKSMKSPLKCGECHKKENI